MGACNMRTVLPFVGMVMVILAQVSNMVVIKAAMSKGINKYVMIVYTNALSTLIFLLFPLIIHGSESNHPPPLTFFILSKLFLLSIFGYLSQICSFVGLQYSSPTLSTAMINLIPAFTFILALIFRMEKLKWRSLSSQAKCLGTLVSIGGAFVVTFYNGPVIIATTHRLLHSSQSNWILGGFFLAGEAFFNSAWYILQTLILKKFPSVVMIMFYLFFFSTILSAVYSLIVVSDSRAWKLRLDMGLLAILYSGIIGTGIRVCLTTWCLSKTGPVFCTMFKPLAIVFSDVMSVFFLEDSLTLGSLIGAVIIVAGFYAVMWGKFKEESSSEDSVVQSFKSSDEKVPLLQNRINL